MALRANLGFRLITTISVAENQSLTRDGSNLRRRSEVYRGVVQSFPRFSSCDCCEPAIPCEPSAASLLEKAAPSA
ncbi:hypothetical protein FPL05_10715 [Xanthomonas citri pv. glycines]|nr:hypothetical protein FPL05_10715 [Xanthomonas citri pv. glycines]